MSLVSIPALLTGIHPSSSAPAHCKNVPLPAGLQFCYQRTYGSSYGPLSTNCPALLTSKSGVPRPKIVVIRAARPQPTDAQVAQALERIERFLARRAVLQHKNLLPFLGSIVLEDVQPGILSLFCENGNITAFLMRYPKANKVKLISDVCQGLEYLHGQGFAHKNVIPPNVLIKDNGDACLSDTGVAVLFRNIAPFHDSIPPETWVYKPWEELASDSPLILADWQKIDVYTLTSTIYEVLSGQPPVPYPGRQSHRSLLFYYTISRVGHLGIARPQTVSQPIWETLQMGWKLNPAQRPFIKEFAEMFCQATSKVVDL